MGLVFQQKESVAHKPTMIVNPLDNIPIDKMTNEQLKVFFPEKTHNLTDPWGHVVQVVTTRQKTVYNGDSKPVIWTDAHIAYLEGMNNLLTHTTPEHQKPKRRISKKLKDEIAELTGEMATV